MEALYEAVNESGRDGDRIDGRHAATSDRYGCQFGLRSRFIHSPEEFMKHVVIVGGGFAGLNAAKELGGVADIEVTLIDKHNHHLFQPLLYQVAMAGLSPADIAAPIRNMLSRYANIHVLLGKVESLDLNRKIVIADIGAFPYDYLILCCGAVHSYFGHDEWEEFAPGLKTLEQATEI